MHAVMLSRARPDRIMAAALLVAYGILAVLYSVTTPAYEAPDEVAHMAYAQSLLERRALPVQTVGELSASHHPPAYYLLAAVAASVVDPTDTTGAFRLNPRFVHAGQGGNAINAGLHGTSESFPYQGQAAALHLARGVSIVLGGVTVMLTIAIGWLVFPDRRGVGLLAGALVALNPQFLFISGAVNNDNLLIAVSTATWWQLIRTFRAPDRLRGWFMVAVLLSVGVLAKSSGLVNVAVVLAALLAMAIKRRSMSLVVKGGAVILATLAVLTGWWFIRNQQLYGDLMGWGVYTEVFAVNMRQTPLWPELGRLFETQFRSYWAVFGWMLVTPPEWFYGVVLAVMLVALAGVIVLFVSRAWSRLSGFQKGMLVLLAGAIVAHEAYLVAANTRFNPSFSGSIPVSRHCAGCHMDQSRPDDLGAETTGAVSGVRHWCGTVRLRGLHARPSHRNRISHRGRAEMAAAIDS